MTAVAPEQTLEAPIEAPVTGKTPWQLFWTRFKKDKAALMGLGMVIILFVLALAAPLFVKITGHGPNELFSREMTDEFGLPKGPNKDFWFGADRPGRTCSCASCTAPARRCSWPSSLPASPSSSASSSERSPATSAASSTRSSRGRST